MKKAAVIGGTHCLSGKLALTPIYESYDILIISYISADLLAKTAAGFETEIIRALKNNKKVFLLKYASNHLEALTKFLTLLYNSYIEKIISYGVKVINCTDEIFIGENRKKLLTAADLEGLRNTDYKISKEIIITPLAMDIAKEKNIKFIKD